MTRNERIKFILERKNVGYEKVAEILQVTKQAIGNRLNREKEISNKAFINAVVQLTGVDENMILKGDGFKDFVFASNAKKTETSKVSDSDVNYNEPETNDYKEAFYNQRDQKFELERKVSELTHLLQLKDTEIKGLEKENQTLREHNKDLKALLGIK